MRFMERLRIAKICDGGLGGKTRLSHALLTSCQIDFASYMFVFVFRFGDFRRSLEVHDTCDKKVRADSPSLPKKGRLLCYRSKPIFVGKVKLRQRSQWRNGHLLPTTMARRKSLKAMDTEARMTQAVDAYQNREFKSLKAHCRTPSG